MTFFLFICRLKGDRVWSRTLKAAALFGGGGGTSRPLWRPGYRVTPREPVKQNGFVLRPYFDIRLSAGLRMSKHGDTPKFFPVTTKNVIWFLYSNLFFNKF